MTLINKLQCFTHYTQPKNLLNGLLKKYLPDLCGILPIKVHADLGSIDFIN